MQLIENPNKNEWASLLERPHFDNSELFSTVKKILEDVKKRGDVAVKEYEEKFDHVTLENLQVTEKEIEDAENSIDEKLKQAIEKAKSNITKFHKAQDQPLPRVETCEGVTCWQKAKPIEKVGLYIPGGTAPLFSTVLMLALPAQIAGCKEITLCTPPNKEGKVNPAVLCS